MTIQLPLITKLEDFLAIVKVHASISEPPLDKSMRKCLKDQLQSIHKEIFVDIDKCKSDSRMYTVEHTNTIRCLNQEIQKLFKDIKHRSMSMDRGSYLSEFLNVQNEISILKRRVQWECDTTTAMQTEIAWLKRRVNILSCHPYHQKEANSYQSLIKQVDDLGNCLFEKNMTRERVEHLRSLPLGQILYSLLFPIEVVFSPETATSFNEITDLTIVSSEETDFSVLLQCTSLQYLKIIGTIHKEFNNRILFLPSLKVLDCSNTTGLEKAASEFARPSDLTFNLPVINIID